MSQTSAAAFILLMAFTATIVAADGNVGDERGNTSLIVAHGWLFWLSFGLLYPLGIFFARYAQQSLPNWFKYHWILQLLATVVGAIALVAVKASGGDDDEAGAHGTIGYVLGGILLTHLAIGFFARPKKGGRFRREWYFSHWLVGTAVVIVGWLNLFLGMKVYNEHYGSTKAFNIAFIVQIAIVVFIYLLLERWPYVMSQSRVVAMGYEKQNQVQQPPTTEMHAI